MSSLYSKDYNNFLLFIKKQIKENKTANKVQLKKAAIKELYEAGLVEKNGKPKKNMIIEPHIGWQ